MKLLFILAVLFSISSAFEITKSNPKLAEIGEEDQDRSVVLSCQTDDHWDICDFSHNGTSVCKIKWTRSYEAKPKYCNDGAEYLGGYSEENKCKVKLTNVGPDQAGQWTCNMTDWDTRTWEESQWRFDTDDMYIEFIPKPTTTTTTTAKPKPSTAEPSKPDSTRIGPGSSATSIQKNVLILVLSAIFLVL